VNTRAGRLLTTDELVDIALANGLTVEDIDNRATHCHNTNLFRSYLLDRTASARLALMWRGELTLDTSQAVYGG
jgi:hypothetical protein